ncbi:hypothetical protein VTN77DRAFT_5916 [Rasamsonia byssochlamydoides]|uniref:uncharacterized protein n=1 Tax=Rasamsonia byssochlamydoides TaxID=89139 RepID=UPI00374467CD
MPSTDPSPRNGALEGTPVRQRGNKNISSDPNTTKASRGNENTRSRIHNEKTKRNWRNIISAVAYTTLPKWVDMGIIGLLIFGGCCGNVFALEAIIKDEPSSGPLITFVQFVTTALFTIPSFLSWSAGPRAFFLSPRAIPLRSWWTYTLFFVTVNLLNNWAFAYRISVPLHIILRSGGPVASMIIGYLYNSRRYSRMQILAVILLTLGVVGAALADADAQGRSMEISIGLDDDGGNSVITFLTGFTILSLAMVLSAFQGVYADRLYAVHGNNHWREALLYSHVLSLPFFLPTYPQLSSQFRAFLSSPPMLSSLSAVIGNGDLFLSNSTTSTVPASVASSTTTAAGDLVGRVRQSGAIASILSTIPSHPLIRSILAQTPIKIFYLVVNAVTQYLCIRGVYLLAAKSSSLTVTIVLNIRKLVSLLLSIYLFGNSLAMGVSVGAGLVFLGGALYGIESARQKKKKTRLDSKNE